jgi:hypothetical protein
VDAVLDFFYKSPWSAILIYGVFGLSSLYLSWLRLRWYQRVQRERSIFIFALTNVFQGLAFTGAALITAPHPVMDFRFLLPYIRIAWLCCLILFLYGTIIVRRKLAELERKRNGSASLL